AGVDGRSPQKAAPAPPAASAARAPTAPSAQPSSTPPSESRASVTTTNLGGPLLAVPHGWELFARDPEAVLRIQLATGRVVRTRMPAVLSDGPMSFVAGPRQVLVKSWQGGGVVIRDGQPAQALSAALAGYGAVLPGPGAGKLRAPPPRRAGAPPPLG